jgi:hypothetical protein
MKKAVIKKAAGGFECRMAGRVKNGRFMQLDLAGNFNASNVAFQNRQFLCSVYKLLFLLHDL